MTSPNRILAYRAAPFKGQSEAFQQKHRAIALALVQFLDQHGLSRQPLQPRFELTPDEFDLFRNDLTPEGQRVCDQGFKEWIHGVSRQKRLPLSVARLEAELADVRAERVC